MTRFYFCLIIRLIKRLLDSGSDLTDGRMLGLTEFGVNTAQNGSRV